MKRKGQQSTQSQMLLESFFKIGKADVDENQEVQEPQHNFNGYRVPILFHFHAVVTVSSC